MYLPEMIEQCVSDSKQWFPGAQTLPHMVLSLAGEVGEIANIVKKVQRGSTSLKDPNIQEELALEVIDVLVYLCNVMGNEAFKDVSWERLWNEKRAYNQSRFGPNSKLPKRLPYQVLAEAGIVPEQPQNWQDKGDFAS